MNYKIVIIRLSNKEEYRYGVFNVRRNCLMNRTYASYEETKKAVNAVTSFPGVLTSIARKGVAGFHNGVAHCPSNDKCWNVSLDEDSYTIVTSVSIPRDSSMLWIANFNIPLLDTKDDAVTATANTYLDNTIGVGDEKLLEHVYTYDLIRNIPYKVVIMCLPNKRYVYGLYDEDTGLLVNRMFDTYSELLVLVNGTIDPAVLYVTNSDVSAVTIEAIGYCPYDDTHWNITICPATKTVNSDISVRAILQTMWTHVIKEKYALTVYKRKLERDSYFMKNNVPTLRKGKYNDMLVFQGKVDIDSPPVLTVGVNKKWCCLYVVHPGTNEVTLFDDTDVKSLVKSLNNTYDPVALVCNCDRKGIYIDACSLDMIIGRWANNKFKLASDLEVPEKPEDVINDYPDVLHPLFISTNPVETMLDIFHKAGFAKEDGTYRIIWLCSRHGKLFFNVLNHTIYDGIHKSSIFDIEADVEALVGLHNTDVDYFDVSFDAGKILVNSIKAPDDSIVLNIVDGKNVESLGEFSNYMDVEWIVRYARELISSMDEMTTGYSGIYADVAKVKIRDGIKTYS